MNDRSDDKEPLSSEELIRRAREGYREPAEIEEPAADAETDTGSTGDMDPADLSPARGETDADVTEALTPRPWEDPQEDRSIDEPAPRREYQAQPPPPQRPAPPSAPDAGTAESQPRQPEPTQPPVWPPVEPGVPGPGRSLPKSRLSGFARLFSIGRWIVGGVFLVFALGQCFNPEASLNNLTAGDCFEDPGTATGLGESSEIGQIETTDCNQLHDFEVFAILNLGSEDRVYPGTNTLFDEMEVRCLDLFSAYVGRDYVQSAYDFITIVPLDDNWRVGDRTGICSLYEFGENFDIVRSIGSALNSGR